MDTKLGDSIKAILFDLDGTLIDCDVNLFTRDYLKRLSTVLAPFIPPKKTISALLKASSAIDESNGSKINIDAFREIFFSIVKQPEEIINPIIDKFYETEFPKLQVHFTTRVDARPLMKQIFDKEYKVVIATTPLLPEVAIRQRLNWAGVGHFPYDLITTIENSRVSKSLTNLSYYENILDEINLSAESCLMVGDEAKDMIAAKLGCKTFLVDSPNTNLDDSIPKPTYHGTLADLRNLI